MRKFFKREAGRESKVTYIRKTVLSGTQAGVAMEMVITLILCIAVAILGSSFYISNIYP